MNKSNKSANVPKSIFVWPVAVLLMAAASFPLKAEKPESLDLLSLALKDVSTLKTSLGTATPVLENGRAVAVDFEFAESDGYPGVEIPSPPEGWDLSPFTGVEAEVENLGSAQIVPVLAVANRLKKGQPKSNATGVTLAPGESGTIRLRFGQSWGAPSVDLDLSAVDDIRVLVGPGQFGILRIKSICAVSGNGAGGAGKSDNSGEGQAQMQLLFGTGGAKKSESPVPVEQAAAGKQFLHYRPAGMRFGDTMPVWRDGVYHVFYLKAQSSPPKELIFAHVSSRDLVHWKEHPDLPMRGCTGCFIVKDGVGYAFTGNSRADRWVSRDPEMEIWERDPAGVSVQLDPRWYHLKSGWRDPAVVWVPEEKKYWMVACARTAAGAGRHFNNGCVSLATSPDLVKWQIEPPLWSPDAWTWPECPDLFQLGNRWALVYLHEGTQLRLADSPRGPWPRPDREVLDKGLSAGRTLFDGHRRLIFGWFWDNGWGGDMLVPRELYLHADGSAAARCAEEVVTACRAAPDATGGMGAAVFRPLSGTWQATPASIKAEMPTGQSAMAIWPDAPENFYLEAKLRIAPGARAFIVLRGKADTLAEAAVAVLADPAAETVSFTQWNTWGSAAPRGSEIAPHKFREGAEIDVQMILRGDLLEVFFDERHSMSTRVARGKGALGLFAREGSVEWKNLVVRKLD